jgi:hypothetical protein
VLKNLSLKRSMQFISQSKYKKTISFYALFALGAFLAGGLSVHLDTAVGREIKKSFDGLAEWQKLAEVEQAEMQEIEKQKDSKLVITLLHRGEGTHTGYTLFTTSNEQRARLIDMNGKIVHEWYKPFNEAFPRPKHVTKPKGNINWSDAWLFPNGDLMVQYNGALDTPYGYGLVKMDKDSKLIWNYSTNSHHTFDIGEDGRVYGLSQKWYKEPIDGFPFLKPPALLDTIYVLSPEGKELDKLDIIDAFRDTAFKDMLKIRDQVFRHVGDYFHTNSVKVLKSGVPYTIPGVKAGMVLVSIRNPDLICIIDLEKRRVVWAAKGQWKQQHSAYFTPDGMISVFDNQGWGGKKSRVIEFDPLTLKEVWSFPKRKEDYFYSAVRGRSSLLPNGNVIIAKSMVGKIIEVNRDSIPVWEVKVERRQANGQMTTQVVSGALRYTKEQLPFMAGTEP